MSKCFDHKTIFLDTPRHFRPAIEISRKFPVVCGCLELQKNNQEKRTCLDSQPMFLNPRAKTTRAIHCTNQNLNCILVVHSIAFFLHAGYTIHLLYFICTYVNVIIYMCIIYRERHISIHIYVYVYYSMSFVWGHSRV